MRCQCFYSAVMANSKLDYWGTKKTWKIAILTRKPLSHAWILMYQTWPIDKKQTTGNWKNMLDSMHRIIAQCFAQSWKFLTGILLSVAVQVMSGNWFHKLGKKILNWEAQAGSTLYKNSCWYVFLPYLQTPWVVYNIQISACPFLQTDTLQRFMLNLLHFFILFFCWRICYNVWEQFFNQLVTTQEPVRQIEEASLVNIFY